MRIYALLLLFFCSYSYSLDLSIPHQEYTFEGDKDEVAKFLDQNYKSILLNKVVGCFRSAYLGIKRHGHRRPQQYSIYITISSNGNVDNVSVNSSRRVTANRSLLEGAIIDCSPYPPLPEYKGKVPIQYFTHTVISFQ